MALSDLHLSSLEKLIQQALALDANALNALQKHHGKSVYIECTEPKLGIVISITNNGIGLQTYQQQTTNSHLQGDLAAYAELLSADDKVAALINGNLRLQGDTQWLVDLQKILQHLDLDWEFQLATLIGDLPAHWLGKLSRQTLAWLHTTRPIFLRHLQEFIQEEAKLSPSTMEIEHFIQQVQLVGEKTERLEALLKQTKKHPYLTRSL